MVECTCKSCGVPSIAIVDQRGSRSNAPPSINLAYTPLHRLPPVLLFDADVHVWATSSMQGHSALEVMDIEPRADRQCNPRATREL